MDVLVSNLKAHLTGVIQAFYDNPKIFQENIWVVHFISHFKQKWCSLIQNYR